MLFIRLKRFLILFFKVGKKISLTFFICFNLLNPSFALSENKPANEPENELQTRLQTESQNLQNKIRDINNDTITFTSGSKQVHLIELYTSQGCSSCPPADHWLSQFKSHDALWQSFIPIAFHVDYWDWIGWKDPFATKENSSRQQHYRQINHLKSVYTPGLVLNGFEWRIKEGIGKSKANAGQLSGFISSSENILDVAYKAAHTNSNNISGDNNLIANVALLGFDIEVDVSSGENRNRSLKHDFVVLNHQQKLSENTQWQFDLPDIKTHAKYAKRFGLAVWISHKGDPSPIQATGTWL